MKWLGEVNFEVEAPSEEQAQETFNRILDYADSLGVVFVGQIMVPRASGDTE